MADNDYLFCLKPDTQAYRLLEIVAICGELPSALLARIPGSTSYKNVLIWFLKKNRLLKTYYRDHLRGYRLGTRGKVLLLQNNPERFAFYLTGNADTNMRKSEVTRRLRLHHIAETYVSMMNADICVFRDEKPLIFLPEGYKDGRISVPAFYSSREIKEMGIETVKIRGSRMIGALIAPSGIFITYHGSSDLTKWDYRAEQRTQALLQIILCQQRLSIQYSQKRVAGLLFGDGMAPFLQILSSSDSNARCFFLLDGNYEHFYYLTNDHYGKILLKLLCDPQRITELNRILSLDLRAGSLSYSIENDAFDTNENPVLFGYLPDIPRINRFLNALAIQERTGILICFDFQMEVYQKLSKERLHFQTISFEKFERRFFP